jgi:hypothetical protein
MPSTHRVDDVRDAEASVRLRDHTFDPSIFMRTVETLSPAHPVGTGRTNVTIIAPTIVQLDTPVPFAGFELVAGRRPGAVAMHVDPAAYGLAPGDRYDVAFVVQTDGACTFSWQAGFDATQRTGAASVNGQGVIGMGLGVFTQGAVGLANIQQTSGTTWRWQRLVITRPLVLEPA